MLASLPAGPLGKPGTWVFEPKMDGIRCIAMIRGGCAQLLSRRGLDLTSQYPRLAAELPALFAGDGIVDGEIIALDGAGRPSFQQLQQRMNLTRAADVERAETTVPVQFFAFDLVRCGDYDFTQSPMSERRRALEALLTPSERVKLIPRFDCDGKLAYEVCIENGFEGIVAKRLNAPYECGRRSPYWVKQKAQQTGDFIIGGYSQGEGARASTFGSLLLGFYDNDGSFIYCGSVGTGFDEKLLAETLRRLKPHICKKTPFKNPPKDKKNCVWVAPLVVAEIKYVDVTRDGHLRAPVFLHFRDDKGADEVTQTEMLVEALPDALSVVIASGDVYERVWAQLAGSEAALELIVDSEKISLTSLNKELWPKLDDLPAITKRDYLRALTHLAPYILPHWQNRPITLIRSPFGVNGKFFFQKYWHTALPEFVDTIQVQDENETKEKLICNNLASLLFFGQHGVLEFHTTTSRADDMTHPDFIVFDIDFHAASKKGPAQLDLDAFKRAREVALLLNSALNDAKLSSFAKLSGKNGIHLFVPIEREFDYSTTRTLAETIARFIVQKHPELATVEFETKKRGGKVYLDCGQNGQGRTIAAPYTPRAVPWASVSVPVQWNDLADVTPEDFTLHSIAAKLAGKPDLWRDILAKPNDLGRALSK